MKIPFLSFDHSNDQVREEMNAAFLRVFESKWYVLGEEVKQFELQYSKFNRVLQTVGVSNGLDALFLSLKTLGIGPGDEVIVPSNTYIASWLAVSYTGATPVPVEPDNRTMNIRADNIEPAISSKTRAIMPVHLYGQACEMDDIMKLAEKKGLYVIEDNAQAQGAACNGRLTGSMGHINATSFYPGKNLGALGDAGAITTNDETLARKARVLRNYGSEKKYFNSVIGYNMRLDEMQAAFLRVKLQNLPAWNEQRIRVAEWYAGYLQGISEVTLPEVAKECSHVYHLFVIRTGDRDGLLRHLENSGIGAMIHYPVPPHLQEAYAGMGFSKGQFPVAESIAETCLSLPVYPGLAEEEVGSISESIKKYFSRA